MVKRTTEISNFGKILRLLKDPTFLMKVRLNLIEGVELMEKFGENPAVGATIETITDIGGVYVPPTQARIHNIVSDDVADVGVVLSSGTATGGNNNILIDTEATFVTDGVAVGDFVINDTDCSLGRIYSVDSETQITVERMASPVNGLPLGLNDSGDSYRVVNASGTGASIFYVHGLDVNYEKKNEFIVLNGTTNVPTINSYTRQYRARVFNAGSSNGAVGTITSTAVTDGTVTCQVVNGSNQTLMAVYTVPVGYVGLLLRWYVSLSKKTVASVEAKLRTGELDSINYITRNAALSSTGTSYFESPFLGIIPGGADVFIEALADVSTGVNAGFDVLLFDNSIWEISN